MPWASFRCSVSTQSPWKFAMRNGLYQTDQTTLSAPGASLISLGLSSLRIGNPLSLYSLPVPCGFSGFFHFFPCVCWLPRSSPTKLCSIISRAWRTRSWSITPNLICIPSMCYDLFWVLFAAKLLTQLQFCFHILIGWECSLLWVPGEGRKSFSKGTIYTFVKGLFCFWMLCPFEF